MRAANGTTSIGASACPAPAAASDEFEFVSSVAAGAWKDVEALFYFHPRQRELSDSIRASVERFGSPEILSRGERIYIGIAKHDAQCLFACHRSRRPGVPVGVVVYLRTQADLLNILHVAVGPAYESSGTYGDRDLAMRLISEVRNVARRVAGVQRIGLPYSGGRSLWVGRGVGLR